MTIETTIKVTLTEKELEAVKTVHNMLANLSMCDKVDLNHAFPLSSDLSSIQEGLAYIYELATDGDVSELD